jgi:hypothetical protein
MLYLGSHNLTKAAWGTYEKGNNHTMQKARRFHAAILNWDCYLLITVRKNLADGCLTDSLPQST